MKKYITVIPMQPKENLHRTKYESYGNELLSSEIETRFPAVIMIANSAVSGETVEVVVTMTEHENVPQNYDEFIAELDMVSKEKGFEYKITKLVTTLAETPEKQYALLGDIVEKFSEEDEIYADITYGAKPTPVVIMMALSYAYEYLKNTDVKAMIYGSYNHATGKTGLYDVSALFYMNSLMHKVPGKDFENPLEVMKKIINL
ncbi:MAG: hypothetical protein E7507_03365 [Ruminococcus sp.]|nr:hypothetical protein [Ruminococcus sp.]